MGMAGQVHAAGGKIMLQLGHTGIVAEPSLTGKAAFGPMAGRHTDGHICRSMTRADIRKTATSFARAAALAREAGFDGVQLHAAHGYLLSSFLSPHYNRRRDEYGGTVENRARLLLEVLLSVREAAARFVPAASTRRDPA
jgi:2,4-dienoyl-CoA reductase-like NADH-dependent reductase (Old Yellow Enzyme family)